MFLCVFFAALIFLIVPNNAAAVYDPVSVANNRFGVHILFSEEIRDAAKLINSNGGEWGYVTIPIQAGDRNLVKWQRFMDDAKRLKVIPIIRLAIEGDYFNTKVWRKPTYTDVLDFANFLNSLNWPTKNRYIVVFNEVNRSDEWGGDANPSEYTDILSYATDIFKARSDDFFIITAGLDNASANISGTSFEPHTFLRLMEQAVPGVFAKIDGLASHSYPNPSFAQPPTRQGKVSVASFRFERELVRDLSGKNLPVFITETGWSQEFVPDELASSYFTQAFTSVWSNDAIVAITPFLLRAHAGPFTVFSLLRQDGTSNNRYNAILNLPKEKGAPLLENEILGEKDKPSPSLLHAKHFLEPMENEKHAPSLSNATITVLRWMLKF